MCDHPFSALREFETETISTNVNVLRARCGYCGVPLTKETLGRPVEQEEIPDSIYYAALVMTDKQRNTAAARERASKYGQPRQ